MKVYDILLKEEYSFLQGGKLQCQLMDSPWDGAREWTRPAVIVVPGGGYGGCSSREADPVAAEFLAKGFQAFVLRYLCAPNGVRYPEQLLELASAVDYVKMHAKEMNINEKEIFVVGFSAGGHLVGNLAVEHQNMTAKAGVTLDCKPTAVGLCYPVISKIHGHQGSYQNLLQGYSEEEQAKLLETLNLNEAVSEQTPPAFIWATAEDGVVPADNALRYALALDNHGISYELHIYPRGAHGLSTASLEICSPMPDLKRVSHWIQDCTEYFRIFVEENF